MPEFYIKSYTWDLQYNPDSDITLYILHNGAWFRICYAADELADSPSLLEQHHEFYDILYEEDPEGKSREVAEYLRRPFEELMTRLAPNPPTEPVRSLHSYLYPPSFILEATVVEDHIQPRFQAPLSRQEFIPPGEHVHSEFIQPHLRPLASKFEKYSSCQVEVLAHTPRLVPSMVCIDGVTYFFKPWVSGLYHGYHELQAYSEIQAAAEASPSVLDNANICRLHGLIIDDDNDVLQHYHLDMNEENWPGTRLVGLLLTFIENKGTMKDLAPWSDCTNEERARWSRQIRDSVQCLHAAGVVWGDAKPENVLIGNDGNAYLVDFGGSYTPGWVEEDSMETVEGDLQGVERIEKYLADWSEKPVTRIDA
ncbi:hypothetical protein F4801DRAFT_538420 [Xylaria longipes]|nr:hypothetical protein F4801DRAFT_538420 [Xylaria longipes]RYC58794.1 hypothetical protein CHU98_g7421 [Xylaria longipes]